MPAVKFPFPLFSLFGVSLCVKSFNTLIEVPCVVEAEISFTLWIIFRFADNDMVMKFDPDLLCGDFNDFSCLQVTRTGRGITTGVIVGKNYLTSSETIKPVVHVLNLVV